MFVEKTIKYVLKINDKSAEGVQTFALNRTVMYKEFWRFLVLISTAVSYFTSSNKAFTQMW